MKNKWVVNDKQSGKIMKAKDTVIDELKARASFLQFIILGATHGY